MVLPKRLPKRESVQFEKEECPFSPWGGVSGSSVMDSGESGSSGGAVSARGCFSSGAALPNSSSRVIPKISAILGSRVISGQHWSDSHLLTA